LYPAGLSISALLRRSAELLGRGTRQLEVRIDTFALWGRDQLSIVALLWDHRLRAHSSNTFRVT